MQGVGNQIHVDVGLIMFTEALACLEGHFMPLTLNFLLLSVHASGGK